MEDFNQSEGQQGVATLCCKESTFREKETPHLKHPMSDLAINSLKAAILLSIKMGTVTRTPI